MTLTLANPWLTLTLQPEQACFSLSHSTHAAFGVANASFGVRVAAGLASRALLPGQLVLQTLAEEPGFPTANGLLDSVRLTYASRQGGYALHVHLGLLREKPLMLLRLRLENLAETNLHPDEFVFLETPPEGLTFNPATESNPFFFSNGWQSWSPARVYHAPDRQQRTHLGLLARPMIQENNAQPPARRGHFTSDMFALLGDQAAGSALVAGFLAQKQQFGTIQADLTGPLSVRVVASADRVTLRPGASLETDWAAFGIVPTASPSPLDVYLSAVQKENNALLPTKPPLGWCSWYHYFTHINAGIIRENLGAIQQMQRALPLELVQIDDGYQKSVGEWLEFNPGFPDGVKPLADEIKTAGLTPGLWLAPYIVRRGTGLISQHPEWLLRDRRGRLVNAGFGWNTLTAGLDLTVPEALDYTREVIHTAAHDWGFPYLKLDFLYAAALPAVRRDPTLTRAQVLRRGLEIIREAAGTETTLLGCGCPLGSGIGLMDLMRISADVGPTWAPSFNGIQSIFSQEPNMPCARNAIQNILTRSSLDQRWWGNDPDCLLTRPDTDLTLAEVQSLATAIGMTGGALLISDDMTRLPEERLRIARALVPHVPPNPRVLDGFDVPMPARLVQSLESPVGPYSLIAFFNWSDHCQDLRFQPSEWGLEPGREWFGREFWTGDAAFFGDEWFFHAVPAHGCRLFTLRELTEQVLYAGSDLHFSQGMEVSAWQSREGITNFTLSLGRDAQGTCYLLCPRLPVEVLCDGQSVQWEPVDGNMVRVPVSVHGQASVVIRY